MAKWGEGDPRWIVEERADATNVNNWHWTEKNATGWSKERLKTLLQGLVIKDDKFECKVKELKKIEGEATANNRKGKLIFFYEWEITGEWKGKLIESDTSYNGNLEIPNLSEENEADEVDVNITTVSTKDEAYQVKDFMRKTGQDKIREKLAMYIKDLKEEYSQGLIKPSKSNSQLNGTTTSKTTPVPKTIKAEMNKPVVSASTKKQQIGVKIDTKNITDKQQFKCRASDLYRSITETQMVRAYAGEDSTVENEKGGRFSLFRGNVTGEFTELKVYEKVCMRWRFKSWPEGHYSEVTLKLEEKDDCTDLKLTQISIPSSDYERTKEGWDRFYWDNIKAKFGFGSRLF